MKEKLTKYKDYKDSGVYWLRKIPSHWKVLKVKHVYYRSKINAEQNNPVILSLARDSIKERDIFNNNGQIAESYYNYNVVKVGDLIINPMDLYSGANCNVSYIEGVISPAYVNLRPLKQSNTRFHDYYFKVQYWIMAMFAHGKGVSFDNRWTLNNQTLMQYPIVVPPLEEQNKIAAYLDKKTSQIDSLIADKQNMIALLKEQRSAIISETATKGLDNNVEYKDSGIEYIGKIPSHWQVKKLKYIFSMNTGLSISKSELKEEGIACIGYGLIHSKYTFELDLRIHVLSFASEKYITSNASALAKEGDFIFCDTSEDIEGSGNMLYISNLDNKQLLAGSHTILLKSKISINARYMAYLFKSNQWKTQIQSKVAGVKVYSITQKILKEVSLLIPSKKEQKQIVEYLDKQTKKIDTLVADIESNIEKLKEYRKSIISEMVTGQWKV